MPKLTELAIKAAKPPEHGTYTMWDDSLKNFGLRVSQGGTKTFIVLIASGRRQKVGRFPIISLADARAEAKIILAEKELGKVRPTHKAFNEAVEEFIDICERKNRPRTVKDYTRLLDLYYSFGRRNVGDVKPREIMVRLNTLNDRPSEKHHAFVIGRIFFKWCVGQHIIDRSPMENLVVPKVPISRERILADDELKAVYGKAITYSSPFLRIVALLCLTGQRRGDIAHLEWNWVGEDTITFPSTITKNKREHTIPICEAVHEVLEATPRLDNCKYVFPAARKMNTETTVFNGWSKPKAALDLATGVRNWTLHDLRRTFSSILAAYGVDQIVVEKILGHTTGGSQSAVAQIYNRHAYMNEMRDAMLLMQDHLNNLLEPEH